MVNAWQYAPPVEPVGSDGGISDPLRFVPPAAAEEAYLVTELGNVFPVDDGSNSADTIIIQNSDNGTKRDVAALNLFLMGSNARIDGISPGNMKFVYGTDSKGSVAEYHPYFKIPIDVKNHTDGYVVLYHDDIQPSVTVPIRDLFSEYTYNPATETLHEVGLHGAPTGTMPNFASTKTAHPNSSMLRSGTVTAAVDGFSVSAQGTYVIKLPPGRAYWVNNDHDRDHDLECDGFDCDTVSIMSTDVDLLGSTSSGRALSVPQFSASDAGGTNYGYSWSWSHKRNIDLTTTFASERISSQGNVVINGELEVDFRELVYCFIGSNRHQYRSSMNSTTIGLSSFVPSTTESNNMIFLNGGTASGSKTLYKDDFSPTGNYQDCTIMWRGGHVKPLSQFAVQTNTNQLYDRGFWINEHMVHWSNAPANFNSNVVVNYTGYGQYIYDDYSAGVNSSAYVYDSGTPKSMSVTVDITHPNISDINPLRLTAPNGRTQNLYLSGNFTDGGSQTFAIYSSLRSIVDGNWILNVADDTFGNVGYLDGWTIEVTYYTAPMYPITQSTRQDPFLLPVYDNDVYMVINKKLPHGTIEVKSDAITGAMGLEITGLPPNRLYSITDNYGFGSYGSTMDAGKITLPNERSWTDVWNPSLKLFSDAFVIRNMTGMNVYDIRNDLLLHLPDSKFGGVVYGTTQYMKLPLMIDTTINKIDLTVDDCAVPDLPLPYLARNYTAADDRHIWIPLVPGLGTICITVDGTELIMRVEDFQSGHSTVEAPSQSKKISSAPGFEFNTRSLNPLVNAAGDPLSVGARVAAGTQHVATTSGMMTVSVSGTVFGSVNTLIFREYSDDVLTGNVHDIENSRISVEINVYKNGDLIRQASLGSFYASGQRSDPAFFDLPQQEDWYWTRSSRIGPSINNPAPDLEMPWHYCDSRSHTSLYSTTTWRDKCPYQSVPQTSSLCMLEADYQIRGTLDGSNVSFDVELGDIIEYRFSASLLADHTPFDCGNEPTATYGQTNVSLDLSDVLFDHKDVQN